MPSSRDVAENREAPRTGSNLVTADIEIATIK